MADNLKDKLKNISTGNGCMLFGVADITGIMGTINIEPKEVFENMHKAVVLGYGLSKQVVATNVDKPSKLYANHYKKINMLLDITSLKIASCIHSAGRGETNRRGRHASRQFPSRFQPQ